jgi:hypothetical protein
VSPGTSSSDVVMKATNRPSIIAGRDPPAAVAHDKRVLQDGMDPRGALRRAKTSDHLDDRSLHAARQRVAAAKSVSSPDV